MQNRRHESAFSFVELMIGIVLTGLLGIFAYRTMVPQVATQYQQASIQRLDKQTVGALQQLQQDLQSVDYLWREYGVRPIAFQDNVGVNDSDLLTMVVLDRDSQFLRQFQTNVEGESILDSSVEHTLRLNPAVFNKGVPAIGDRMLIYSPNQFAIGKVSSMNVSGANIFGIHFEPLSNNEIASMGTLGIEAYYPETLEAFPFDKTFFQKVHIVGYKLKTIEVNGKADTYLMRVYDGVESPLAPMREIQYSFNDMTETVDPVGLQICVADPDTEIVTCPDPEITVNWANIVAVNVDFTSQANEKLERNHGMRISLIGDPVSESEKSAKTTVVGTGDISNATTGRPELEVSPQGVGRMILPVINFTSAYASSSGEVHLVDPDTGSNVGTISLTTSSGDPFLPMGVVSDRRPNSTGVFVHGFASVSGVLRPTLAHLSRNSSTGLIESDTTVIVQDFDPLPGLQDTASFAVVEDGTPGYGPHLYVADYTREDDELYVYRTGFDGSSFDPTFTQVYYDNTKGAARITALGRGPTGKQDYSNEDLADRYVSMCLSNTADGATDGEILVAKFIGNYTGTPTGLLNAPVPVGTHNGECTSIDATKQGSLVVGGRLIAMPINQPDLASILLGDADPVELETDHRTTNSAVPNTLFYASNFVIAASAFENGAPPIAGRSIERARGFSMLPAAGTLRVAFSNDQTAGAANAFAAKVELGGATQKVVAQVKATQGNLNSSAVFTGFHPGTNDDLPGWLPKGQMKANDMRITPTPTCRTRGATVALAYRCIAEKMGIDIDEVEVLPTPTPTPTPEPTATPTPTPPDTGGPSGGGDVDGAVDIGGGGSSGGGRDPSCPAGQDPEDC